MISKTKTFLDSVRDSIRLKRYSNKREQTIRRAAKAVKISNLAVPHNFRQTLDHILIGAAQLAVKSVLDLVLTNMPVEPFKATDLEINLLYTFTIVLDFDNSSTSLG